MSNIVGLRGQPTPDNADPVPSVVEALEEMLEAARAGHLIGLGCVTIDRNQIGGYSLTGYLSSYAALGAADLLKTNLCLSILEGDE